MKITKTIFTISFLIIFSACEGFLEISPQGELTQEVFPTSPEDAELATTAIYTSLRDWEYNSGGYPILDFMSDDALKGSSPDDGSGTVGPYVDFTHSPTQDGLDRWWNTLYRGIRRANIVIESLPPIMMDEDLKTRYTAEARFLRGLFYFDLARAFGEVPLVTSPEPDIRVPKSPVEDIYDLVVDDLEFAAANLPLKSEYEPEDLGRVTSGAANALLARMYLYRSDFENAEIHALIVINSNEYELEPVYEDANGVNGEQGPESVLEVGAVGVESTGAGGNQFANTQGVRGSPNRGWGFNRPTIGLRDAFETDDPREEGTVIELGDVIDGITILGDTQTPDETTNEMGTVIEIESYNRKVWVPGTSTPSQFGHNRRIIRYADVLLMAAEALNENNEPALALPYLNEVRERAREGNAGILPDITEMDQDLLRELIYNERRVELALEGHRFWDLIRTGRAVDILGPLGFEENKHEFLPIPQSEIDLSQGSLIQNSNWN